MAIATQRCWRAVVLVELANYPMLRRQLGHQCGQGLADVLARHCSVMLATSTQAIARDLVEVELSGVAREEVDRAVAEVAALFQRPWRGEHEELRIDVHIGAAAVRAALCDDIRLIEEAELALAEARSEHRPIVRDVARASIVHDRLALARDLPRAIERGELFLQYQPKLHVRQQRIASVEALVRWRHPTRGLVLPNDFIPLAEQSRDIVALTLWTIRQAIADQALLAQRGHDIPIFINIAGVLLTDAIFVRHACALIETGGSKIGFEITETSVIRDPQGAIANLTLFAEMGIVIAIDDYGAGLSSLAYLKQLPARELKIDKLFITQLTSSNRDPLIVRSTIDLAHALEMEVVAEGVETPASLALLSVMGCDIIQGFLISRPLGLDGLFTFLDERPGTPLPSISVPFLAKLGGGMRATG